MDLPKLPPELFADLLAESGSPVSVATLARITYARGANDQLDAICQWVAAWPWGPGLSGALIAQQIRASQRPTPPQPTAKEAAVAAFAQALKALENLPE